MYEGIYDAATQAMQRYDGAAANVVNDLRSDAERERGRVAARTACRIALAAEIGADLVAHGAEPEAAEAVAAEAALLVQYSADFQAGTLDDFGLGQHDLLVRRMGALLPTVPGDTRFAQIVRERMEMWNRYYRLGV